MQKMVWGQTLDCSPSCVVHLLYGHNDTNTVTFWIHPSMPLIPEGSQCLCSDPCFGFKPTTFLLKGNSITNFKKKRKHWLFWKKLKSHENKAYQSHFNSNAFKKLLGVQEHREPTPPKLHPVMFGASLISSPASGRAWALQGAIPRPGNFVWPWGP